MEQNDQQMGTYQENKLILQTVFTNLRTLHTFYSK